MVYDDVVIGSGLSAIGTVLGLPLKRKVLVIGGLTHGSLQYYDANNTTPCALLSHGGLGNYWHGVISTGTRGAIANSNPDEFAELFQRFYPRTKVTSRIGHPWVFVPHRPIRPATEWRKLCEERGANMTVVDALASRFTLDSKYISIFTESSKYHVKRLWICSGALHTPFLLEKSLDVPLARNYVSDHVISYLGQIDRGRHSHVPVPKVERSPEGIWCKTKYSEAHTGLFTYKPARFAFEQLDFGIEQRAVFGLPTGSAIKKIVRRASPGLLAEALYNKFGLFPGARILSVYAQIVASDAYDLVGGKYPLRKRHDVIMNAVDAVHAKLDWPELLPTRRRDLYLPAIHLHHSLDIHKLSSLDINGANSLIQIMDSSIYKDIGPDHHSFNVMLAARERSRNLTS